MSTPKNPEVKIEHISAAAVSNMMRVFGLGSDQKIYVWDDASGEWRLHSAQV